MGMFCGVCGGKREKKDKFCMQCGAPFGRGSAGLRSEAIRTEGRLFRSGQPARRAAVAFLCYLLPHGPS